MNLVKQRDPHAFGKSSMASCIRFCGLKGKIIPNIIGTIQVNAKSSIAKNTVRCCSSIQSNPRHDIQPYRRYRPGYVLKNAPGVSRSPCPSTSGQKQFSTNYINHKKAQFRHLSWIPGDKVQITGTGSYSTHPVSYSQARYFSSNPKDGPGGADDAAAASNGGDDGNESDGGESDVEGEIHDSGSQEFPNMQMALAPMTVPEEWPNVPVIAIKRHPVFPRFIKMIEVCALNSCIYLK